MSRQEAEAEYLKALKLGEKESNELRSKGENPFPLVLDEILGETVSDTVQYLGVIEIPAERIVGTKCAGRISAFSASFLPLLSEETEFALKWTALCAAHLGEEGIQDPIVCYEYMGRF